MTLTNQPRRPHDAPPPGPLVLQLVDVDPEADALALANAMALRDDLEARSDRRVLMIVKDPPPSSRRHIPDITDTQSTV